MGRNHSRLGTWALAILTSLCLMAPAAYADHGPRVHAGGQFFTPNPQAPNGTAKVTFGLEAKLKKDNTPDGNFEYFNHASGLKAHGKITSVTFGTASPSCVFFGDPGLAGKPSATVSGQCEHGDCSFSMEVVDGDDSSPNAGDWVCNVNVQGYTKMNTPAADSDPAEPVIHGDVEVKPTGDNH